MASTENHEYTGVVEKLLQERGVDFRAYKPTTLGRRTKRRLEETQCPDADAYLAYLESHPDEYARLVDSLLINVTEFFRDPEAWRRLEKEVIPQMLDRKARGELTKVWSAGCATGEEPYSIAILISEALGSRKQDYPVRIYATDIDDHALSVARRGTYPEKALATVPEHLREKYSTGGDGLMSVNRDLRKMVIFGANNLVSDAPISRCDLIVCRNVLIYMNVPLQNQILWKFHYALASPGYLFLGRAEAMLRLSRLFSAVDERARIFAKEAPAASANMPAAAHEDQSSPCTCPSASDDSGSVPMLGGRKRSRCIKGHLSGGRDQGRSVPDGGETHPWASPRQPTAS